MCLLLLFDAFVEGYLVTCTVVLYSMLAQHVLVFWSFGRQCLLLAGFMTVTP